MTSNDFLLQTNNAPLTLLSQTLEHIDELRSKLTWTGAGILYDRKPGAILFVLLEVNEVVAVFRCSLTIEDSNTAASSMIPTNGRCLEIAGIPDLDFSSTDVRDFAQLTKYWNMAQSKQIQEADLKPFFESLYSKKPKAGRGRSLNVDGRNQVLLDSHGRCMFNGCAVDLTRDALTGKKGNFKALAHNVASSEQGTRGLLYLSEGLSNDPDNVLVLCDIHHRLIDLVAKVDYPADRIKSMRQQFCVGSSALLDTMRFQPIPAICVCWPVREDHFSLPTAQQISESFAPLKARWSGELYPIVEKDESLRLAPEHIRWSILPGAIEAAASRVDMLASNNQFHAGLFATGTMPALIALGAKIGNKSDIVPMLKHREGGKWFWPSEYQADDCTNITGLEELSYSEPEIILQLALTAYPESMQRTSRALGYKIVTIKPHNILGNGSLAHYKDGLAFRQAVQELFHKLKNTHGVQNIHLLPCASNAACVFFGQAFDNYHPDITLYDFAGDRNFMKPRLKLSSYGNKCQVLSI